MEAFEHSGIWKRTLAERPDDPDAAPRKLLRDAFLAMRDRAKTLVGEIHRDLPTYTVHDITHLDALWEVADLLAGPDYPLTPAEAFVLGGSFLLHDAAMSVASYPGGVAEMRSSIEWKDTVARILGAKHRAVVEESEFTNLDADTRGRVVGEVLRLRHAKHAELLGTISWPGPNGSEFLIENSDLRDYYGKRIGQIARSHWLDAYALTSSLRTAEVTPPTSLPAAWVVSPIKTACLLRVADAAHIDHRRAPTFLFALRGPRGVAAQHWTFQNKIGRLQSRDGYLEIGSGSEFSAEHAESWWLAFETAKMIDRELEGADHVLMDSGLPRFETKRVRGVDSPEAFAVRLPASGWKPVDTSIRIGNVPDLVRRLGGQQLYGRDPWVPIRELIQNAADAVRARRRLQEREDSWGEIEVALLPDMAGDWLLSVTDNGVGMTERVITEVLLDFGRSLWKDSLVSEEFPGLAAAGMEAAGRFGIGFFSIFLIADKAKVVSRPYGAARDTARVLEMHGLFGRSILRTANQDELRELGDGSTTISFHVRSEFVRSGANSSSARLLPIGKIFREELLDLASTLDTSLFVRDSSGRALLAEANAWITMSDEAFVERFKPRVYVTTGGRAYADGPRQLPDSSWLRKLTNQQGRIVGRCAVFPSHASYAVGSIGGLRSRMSEMYPILGVLTCSPDSITRREGTPIVEDASWVEFLAEQREIWARHGVHFSQQALLAAHLATRGVTTGSLKIALLRDDWVNMEQIMAWATQRDEVLLAPTPEAHQLTSVLNLGPIDAKSYRCDVEAILFPFGFESAGSYLTDLTERQAAKLRDDLLLTARSIKSDSSARCSLEARVACEVFRVWHGGDAEVRRAAIGTCAGVQVNSWAVALRRPAST